jgi:hypothetical protein
MLKTNATGDPLVSLVNNIATCVDNIIYESQGTLDISPGMSQDAMADADDILAVLGEIRNEILDLGDTVMDTPGDRSLKQKIADSSYEVAKETKALASVFSQ